MKKILVILLLILFLVTVTAGTVSAIPKDHKSGSGLKNPPKTVTSSYWIIDSTSGIHSTSGSIDPKIGSAGSTSGQAPLTVKFKDLSISEHTITNWEWNFGDGSPYSHDKDPEHTYKNEGQYAVTLTVTNDQGSKATYSTPKGYINVINAAETQTGLTVDFSTNRTGTIGNVPLTVNFEDRSQSNSNIVDWHWDFGNGDSVNNVQNPSYTYIKPGTYTVNLTAWDNNGNMGTEVKNDYIRVRAWH